MKDFSQKYRGVTYFGLWADDTADVRGMADAFRVLQRAAKETYDEDVRCEDVNDALGFLMSNNARNKPLRDFKSALDIADPAQRYHAVRHALVRIKLAISRNTESNQFGSSH